MNKSFFKVGVSSLLLTSLFPFACGASVPKAKGNAATTAKSEAILSQSYWQNALRPVLPKGWIVMSVQRAAAPEGWRHTSGGNGIAVMCKNPKVMIRDRMVGSYQPSFTLSIMPQDWEGQSPREQGEYLQGGKYRVKPTGQGTFEARQIYPARYLGHSQPNSSHGGHYFGSITGHAGWNEPNEAIARQFRLVIDKSQ